MTLNACTNQQDKMKLEDIKEIWVYDYFNSMGYGVGGLVRKFQELENDTVAKFQLPSLFVDSLKNILIRSAIAKKLMPSKCGTNLIFAQFVMKDSSIRNIIINSQGIVDYFVGYMTYFISDDKNKQDETLWVNNFYNRIRNKDF